MLMLLMNVFFGVPMEGGMVFGTGEFPLAYQCERGIKSVAGFVGQGSLTCNSNISCRKTRNIQSVTLCFFSAGQNHPQF